MKGTVVEMNKYIGKRGVVTLNGMQFEVEVKDARTRWGHTDLKISPVGDFDKSWAWVDFESVAFND